MAGNSTMRITFVLDGDGKGFRALSQDADGLKKSLQSALAEAGKFNARTINFAALTSVIDQAQGALRGLQGALTDLSQAYAQQETAETKLAVVMKQRMTTSDAEIESIKQLTAAQQRLGVIGDEVQLQGAQQMATFLRQKASLDVLIPAMNNLIAQQRGLSATGSDAVSVANMMGKAMQGQVTALKRVGISFTDAQAEMMKFGTESERAVTLAQIITDNVGDMNAELAKTDSGRMKQLENSLGDLKEKLGAMTNAALPFVTIAANATIALGGIMKLIAGFKTAAAAIRSLSFITSAYNVVSRATAAACQRTSAAVIAMGGSMKIASVAAGALKFAIRGLLISTGIGAVVAGLTFVIEKLAGASDTASISLGKLGEAEKKSANSAEQARQRQEELNATMEDVRTELELNIAKCKDFKGTKQQEQEICESLNNTYGSTLGYFKSVADWYTVLTSCSEAYCRQMVLEAKARQLANQIAKEEIELDSLNNKLNYKPAASLPNIKSPLYHLNKSQQDAYSRLGWPVDNQGNVTDGRQIVLEKQAQAAKQRLQNLQNQLKTTIDEANKNAASLKARGHASVTPPRGSGGIPSRSSGSGKGNSEKELKYTEDYKTLEEVLDNIAYKQKELNSAPSDEARKIINAQIQDLETVAALYREMGKKAVITWTEEAKTLQEVEDNLTLLQEAQKTATGQDLEKVNRQIEAHKKLREELQSTGIAAQKAAEASPRKYNELATTLEGITTNIDLLNEQLQTASLEEAATINRSIQLWEKKADAIRSAGMKAKSTFEVMQEGWGTISGLSSAVSGMISSLKSSSSAFEKLINTVDGIFKIAEGIAALVSLVNLLSGASKAATAAKTAEATATAADTAAKTADMPVTIASVSLAKTASAAYQQMAAAKIFAAHAYIPFAGPAISAGYVAMMEAIVLASGTKFARGGIAYGPTLGLFGEYAGSSANPEVVAPLDRLKDLIKPQGDIGGRVVFKMRGRELIGVLEQEQSIRTRR